MLTAYGHARIEWEGRVFNLSPSFVKIAKIGTPPEIIETFKDFVSTTQAMVSDIITLAEHCLVHGVCGKVESKGKGEPVTEFDAYSYMELARIHLNLSLDDASRMTMTEFLRLMEAKFPPERNENEASAKDEADLLEWFNSNNKAH